MLDEKYIDALAVLAENALAHPVRLIISKRPIPVAGTEEWTEEKWVAFEASGDSRTLISARGKNLDEAFAAIEKQLVEQALLSSDRASNSLLFLRDRAAKK